ncbi:MAG TPA: GNAT family N-acetyltransferase [Candidatus Deferrimicrobium sp.]|nr:GNAT family N-acetyltransferase [Candidatus Kapabacteria bacterium]HLP61733.1 GNAT family N-acetyltransferase [Candidatus Deferrimicrobium sp.]
MKMKMNHESLIDNNIKYLNWDSHFFGFSIGRIHALTCTEMHLRKKLEQAGKAKIQFVELFCDASDSESISACEGLAFHLADLRLTFKKKPGPDVTGDRALTGLTFKKAGPGDIDGLKMTGHGLFANSRYYRYPGFDRNKVDSMFQLWIEKAVTGEFDDELYYLSDETGILAFNSLKTKDNTTSIGLFGVNEDHWGKGLGSLLLNKVSHLLHERQVTGLNVVTQGKNTSAIQLYQKNGFHLTKVTLCYYKWLETKEK